MGTGIKAGQTRKVIILITIVPFMGTGIKIFAVVFRGARASYPSWVRGLKRIIYFSFFGELNRTLCGYGD